MKDNGRCASNVRRQRWDPALGEAFLALLRETGNARAAARRLGRPNAFHNRRRRDAAFRAKWDAAVADADAKLKNAVSAFPAQPPGRPRPLLDTSDDELGGILRPGRKPKQKRPQPVIRRTSNGRSQITLARDGHVTAEIEAEFLARLAATGNFNRSALSLGFQPNSLYERVRKWPAFAAACDDALAGASVRIDYALIAHAHYLLGTADADDAGSDGAGTDGAGTEGAEDGFDPAEAMRILAFLDARKGGRTTRGPRKGPPDRSFEEARESLLRKIEAMERHRKAMGEQGGGEEG